MLDASGRQVSVAAPPTKLLAMPREHSGSATDYFMAETEIDGRATDTMLGSRSRENLPGTDKQTVVVDRLPNGYTIKTQLHTETGQPRGQWVYDGKKTEPISDNTAFEYTLPTGNVVRLSGTGGPSAALDDDGDRHGVLVVDGKQEIPITVGKEGYITAKDGHALPDDMPGETERPGFIDRWDQKAVNGLGNVTAFVVSWPSQALNKVGIAPDWVADGMWSVGEGPGRAVGGLVKSGVDVGQLQWQLTGDALTGDLDGFGHTLNHAGHTFKRGVNQVMANDPYAADERPTRGVDDGGIVGVGQRLLFPDWHEDPVRSVSTTVSGFLIPVPIKGIKPPRSRPHGTSAEAGATSSGPRFIPSERADLPGGRLPDDAFGGGPEVPPTLRGAGVIEDVDFVDIDPNAKPLAAGHSANQPALTAAPEQRALPAAPTGRPPVSQPGFESLPRQPRPADILVKHDYRLQTDYRTKWTANENYRVNPATQARHASGAPGKSTFYPHVNADRAVLDAAHAAGFPSGPGSRYVVGWHAGKGSGGAANVARVEFDRPVGYYNGRPTNVIEVRLKKSGIVHGFPAAPQLPGGGPAIPLGGPTKPVPPVKPTTPATPVTPANQMAPQLPAPKFGGNWTYTIDRATGQGVLRQSPKPPAAAEPAVIRPGAAHELPSLPELPRQVDPLDGAAFAQRWDAERGTYVPTKAPTAPGPFAHAGDGLDPVYSEPRPELDAAAAKHSWKRWSAVVATRVMVNASKYFGQVIDNEFDPPMAGPNVHRADMGPQRVRTEGAAPKQEPPTLPTAPPPVQRGDIVFNGDRGRWEIGGYFWDAGRGEWVKSGAELGTRRDWRPGGERNPTGYPEGWGDEAPGPYHGALANGQGVRYSPVGTAIGNDPVTRLAWWNTILSRNPRWEKDHFVLLHGANGGGPVPGANPRVPVHSAVPREQLSRFDVNPAQIAEAVMANPHFRPGQTIRLASCHAGACGWPQEVANLTGSKVIAALDAVEVLPDGRLLVRGFGQDLAGWAEYRPGVPTVDVVSTSVTPAHVRGTGGARMGAAELEPAAARAAAEQLAQLGHARRQQVLAMLEGALGADAMKRLQSERLVERALTVAGDVRADKPGRGPEFKQGQRHRVLQELISRLGAQRPDLLTAEQIARMRVAASQVDGPAMAFDRRTGMVRVLTDVPGWLRRGDELTPSELTRVLYKAGAGARAGDSQYALVVHDPRHGVSGIEVLSWRRQQDYTPSPVTATLPAIGNPNGRYVGDIGAGGLDYGPVMTHPDDLAGGAVLVQTEVPGFVDSAFKRSGNSIDQPARNTPPGVVMVFADALAHRGSSARAASSGST